MANDISVLEIPTGYKFQGALDGRVSAEQFATLLNTKNLKLVELDFGGVARANSAGIFEWLRFLKDYKPPSCYINCQPWMVAQFNIINQFFPHGNIVVKSMFAPFYNEEEEANKNFLFYLGKDIPLLKDYAGFSMKPIEENGRKFYADFEASKYFQFVGRHSPNFMRFFEEFSLLK